MGASQSYTPGGSAAHQKLGELLLERGDDSLAVEVHSAEYEEDSVTVFSYYSSESKTKTVVDNCLQSHKTLRHPYILKFLTTYRSDGATHIVTEAATPLTLCMDYLTSWEVTVGLSKILQVLDFLHTQAGFSHNNISSESIFITPDGEWKLGRLDCVRRFADNNMDYMRRIQALLSDDNVIPSYEKQAILSSYCRDIGGFGHVCESLLDKLRDFDDQSVSNFSDTVELMLSETDSDIPPAALISSQTLLSNHLIITLKFIEEITLKTSGEKNEFFNSLLDKLRELPEVVIAKMLVRPLLKRFVVEEQIARTLVLPKLLTPKASGDDLSGLISPKLYKRHLPPVIYRLFTVKEYNIRLLLLQTFHTYCHLMDKTKLEKYIMPLILQGLHDSHDVIVSHTLQALSHLVPVLTGSVVIGTDRRDIFIESSARSARLLSALRSQQSHKQQPSTREEEENSGSVNEDDVSSPKKSQRKSRPQRKPRETKPRSENKPLKLGAKKSAAPTDSSTTSQAVRSPSADSQTDQLNTSTRQTSLHASEAVQSDDEEIDNKSDEDFSDWEDFEDTSIVVTGNHSDGSNSADDTHEQSTQRLNRPNEQSGIIRKLDSTEKYGETSHESSKAVSKSERSTRGSMSLKSAPKKATKQSTPKINDDFSQLDIKASVKKAASPSSGEMDFFADMVPTIKSSASSSQDKKHIDNSVDKPPKKAGGTNLAFALQSTESELKDGWGGEEDGWDW